MRNYSANVTLIVSLLLFTFTFHPNYNRARQLNFAKARHRSCSRQRESSRHPSTVKFKAATFGKISSPPDALESARGTNRKVSSPFDVFRRVSTMTRPAQKLALPCPAPLVNDRQGGMDVKRAGGRKAGRESCVREGDQADGFHIHTSTGAHRLYARLIRDHAEPLVRTSVHPFANPLGRLLVRSLARSRAHAHTRGIDRARVDIRT